MLTKAYIGLVVWVELNCLIQIISMPWRLSKFSPVTYSLLWQDFESVHLSMSTIWTLPTIAIYPYKRHTFDLAFPLSINKSGTVPPKLWNATKAIWAFHASRKSKIVAHASWLKDSVACRPRNRITHQADAEDNLPTAYAQVSLLCQLTSMFPRC